MNSSQTTLEERFVNMWDINVPMAQVTREIAEVKAIDCQPLSVVEYEGVLSLLKHIPPN